jgi:hypothetical protein
VEASHRDNGEEEEGLAVPQVAAGNVGRDDDEGKVRHHVRLEHLDQRLGALQRHNVLVDNVAIAGVLRRRRAADGRVFRQRLLSDGAGAALQAEEVLDLLLEGLDASSGVSVRMLGLAIRIRVALCGIVASASRAEHAVLAQTCTSAAVSPSIVFA